MGKKFAHPTRIFILTALVQGPGKPARANRLLPYKARLGFSSKAFQNHPHPALNHYLTGECPWAHFGAIPISSPMFYRDIGTRGTWQCDIIIKCICVAFLAYKRIGGL
jgi:hypothetical protein